MGTLGSTHKITVMDISDTIRRDRYTVVQVKGLALRLTISNTLLHPEAEETHTGLILSQLRICSSLYNPP